MNNRGVLTGSHGWDGWDDVYGTNGTNERFLRPIRRYGSHSSHGFPAHDFTRAVAIGPPQAEFHNNCGVLHGRDGHLDRAIADFDEAIRISPDFVPAWANRALTRARLSQVDLALDEVRTMVELATSTAEDTDSFTRAWISVPDSDSEPPRRFRDEASQHRGVADIDSTTQQETSEGGRKSGR